MDSKTVLKKLFLKTGIYYKVQRYRFGENNQQKKFYSGFIKKHDLVFDVGANVGNRSELFLALGAKVVAIEPHPFCISHLRSRFMFKKNIIIKQLALSDKEGHSDLFLCGSHTMSSMSQKFMAYWNLSQTWEKKIEVNVSTLNQLIEKHGIPKFIKIDVEGYELSVLEGLSVHVPIISFEFTPGLIDEAEKCISRLEQVSENYCYNYSIGEELSFGIKTALPCSVFKETVLPYLNRQGSFGDIYAIDKTLSLT